MFKILMPQLGETVNEGTVAAWHKQVGEEVQKNELLLEVETDKVAIEIPAQKAGILTRILVAAGETVAVGTVLAIVGEEDDTEERVSSGSQEENDRRHHRSEVVGSRRAPGRGGDGKRLSPAVRRLVAEHGLDISRISGTGKDGRISRKDVLEYVGRDATGANGPAGRGETQDRIPFDRIRRVSAQRMVQSKSTIPHVLQAIEVDFSAVCRCRAEHGESFKKNHGHAIGYQAFVAAAICKALHDFPRLNASVDGEALILHKRVNLGIAIDLNFAGLVVPVISEADQLGLPGLAAAIAGLAGKAQAGELSPDDYSGATYTLSNPGPFGTFFTAPIINPPQVGILSMDAIRKRAVVVENDAIEARPVGVLAQSFDHRAVDGAYSAAFLNRLKTIIETSDWAACL